MVSAKAYTIRTSHDLAAMADIWPSIAAPLPGAHIFQTREYLEVWLQTIGAARRVQPCFVSVSDAHGLRALLPLGIEMRRGARVLTFLDGGVCDYNAPILLPTPEGAAPLSSALWREIIAAAPSVDSVVLEKMPLRLGNTVNPLSAGIRRTAPPSAYEIPLAGTWPAYEASRLHRAKDSRRKRRRLAEAGSVRFIVAQTRPEAERLFAALIAQKTRRYFEKNGSDGFERPGYRRYFEMMTERFFPAHVHISALEVNGELLATHWGLLYGRRFYCLMLAYAASPLAQYSPARLLVEDLIAWCYANGFDTFDLGVGDARWKMLVGAEPTALAHTAMPLTAYGWAYDSAKKLARGLIDARRHADADNHGAQA